MKKILFVIVLIAIATTPTFFERSLDNALNAGSSTVSERAINATPDNYDKTYFNHANYDTPYIGNKYRGTFHYRDCESVAQMDSDNQVPLETREEAIQKGFRPCGNCRP